MQFDTPLRETHRAWVERESARATPEEVRRQRPGAAVGSRAATEDVEYVPYGPPDEAGQAQCEIPAAFGAVEIEYASIRRGAAVVDCPQRGTLRVRGADRRAFLDSMLTQKLADLAAGQTRAAFWLNRQGRIEADLLLAETGDEIVVDVDVHRAASAAAGLDGFVFTEDVQIRDTTAEDCRLVVHGPMALETLAHAAGGDALALEPMGCARGDIAGVDVTVARRDQTGEVGLEITVTRDRAARVWNALLAADEPLSEGRRRVRPVGWYAYNIARIEAGTPLLNVDFGPNNLPHETGVLRDRVSFSKGCYLGQEIVARVENLGKPKSRLVGLRMDADLLPVAEGQVFEKDETGMGEPIGVVTSSTLSPMLGARPVAFAMLRAKSAEAGTTVLVNAEGEQGTATVVPLRFWPAPEDDTERGPSTGVSPGA